MFIAVPDGVDLKGERHCHLFLSGEHQNKGSIVQPKTRDSVDVYVNLLMITDGLASAQDYGVSNACSTKLMLTAFRKLDKFEK